MRKILAFVALTLSTVLAAHANPSVSVAYVYDEAIKNEGVSVEVAHQFDKVQVAVNGTADNDRLQSYGASVGYPVVVPDTKLVVTPALGVEHYRSSDEVVGTVGLGAKYPIYRDVYLDGRAKLVLPFDNTDEVGKEGVFQVGLTKKF